MKMTPTSIIILIFLCLIHVGVKAQKNVRDSVVKFPQIGFEYSFQMPGGDMAKSYGNSGAVGIFAGIKSKKNFVINGRYDFIFGSTVKDDHLLDGLKNSSGFIIDENGHNADILLQERGWLVSFTGGKVFPVIGPNPNSGVEVLAGGGVIQHRIKLVNEGGLVPHLRGDYAKGYDRLTNGFFTEQYIGYSHHSNNRLVNFKIGIECIQGFTKNRRSYDIPTRQRITDARLDLLFGLRLGWVFPLYKKEPESFYFY